MKLRDLFKNELSDTLTNSYWNDRFKQGHKYPFIGIDLIFGNGYRIRLSTETVSMESGSNTICYQPLLMNEFSISENYDWKGGSPSQRTFTISIEAQDIDPMTVILGGQFLAGSAEISLIDNDVPYEKRFVIMIGDMIGGVTFGSNNETIEVDISDPKLTIDRIIPEFITTKEALGTLIPSTFLGFRYPLLFNMWNYVPCIMSKFNVATPIYLVGYGHDIKVSKAYRNGKSVVSQELALSVNSIPDNSLYQWEVVYLYDELGRPYTALQFHDSNLYVFGENTFENSDSVYCDITTEKRYTVIGLIRMLLSEHTDFKIKGLDEVLFSRAQNKQPSFLTAGICINGSGDNSVTTMDYITSTLLSSFPMIQLAYSSQGIGVVFTDRKLQYTVLDLVRGQNLIYDRVSALQESSLEELYNVFTLQYDYNAMEDNYKKTVERNSTNNNLCKLSEQKVGRRELEVIQSINIFDDSVAEYVLDWYTNHYTLPSYTVSYVGTPRLFFLLKVGDNIQLTDDLLGLNKVKGTVTDIEYKRGEVVLGLRLWILYDVISSSTVV